MNYNFGVLNDKEFEELCKDLLDIDLEVKFQIFKQGKDQGIDLLYADTVENEIIVQVKHYWNSGFPQLKSGLIHIELDKVKKLDPRPKRYIVCTSLKINQRESKEVVAALKPYLANSKDVYGYNRLASILSLNDRIERKFYKLWLTSTAMIERILHNGQRAHSEFFRDKINEKIALYVRTDSYDYAKSMLVKNKFLIIKGLAGVGKTSLAYILLCDLMAQDYELVYIIDKLGDVEGLLWDDPKKKQVVFFDDFLGSNLHDIDQPRNVESHLINFIDRIMRSKNKLLILTTRTTILKQANHVFEKFKREDQVSISNFTVNLKDYSLLNKAQILYNHLYHTGIGPKEYEIFTRNKNYLKIIQHKNYAPRLIEFITKMGNFHKSGIEKLEAFIFHNLDNPEEIWHHPYKHQLTEEDRILLSSLFSLGGYLVKEEYLEQVFEARYAYEIKSNNVIFQSEAFTDSLRRLLDGFVASFKDANTGINSFSFINPSVGDFLLNYYKKNKKEKWRVFASVVFTDQFGHFFDPFDVKHVHFTDLERPRLLTLLNERAPLLSTIEDKSVAIEVVSIYDHYFKDQISIDSFAPWLSQSLNEKISSDQFDIFFGLIEHAPSHYALNDVVQENWDMVVAKLYSAVHYEEDFAKIREVFSRYEKDFAEFMLTLSDFEIVKKSVQSRFDDIAYENDFSSSMEDIASYYYDNDRSSAIRTIRDKLTDMYVDFIDDCDLSEYYDDLSRGTDWDEYSILENLMSNYEPVTNYNKPQKIAPGKEPEDLFDDIDRLFKR